jgi:hypothetical protein
MSIFKIFSRPPATPCSDSFEQNPCFNCEDMICQGEYSHPCDRLIEHEETYTDEVGGFHDCGIGWNPQGVWCGECSKASCKDCVNRFNKKVDE